MWGGGGGREERWDQRKRDGRHIHMICNLAMLLRHRRISPLGLQHRLNRKRLHKRRTQPRLRILLVQLREILHVRIPRRHIHPGGADRVGIGVFPLGTLLVGEEPEGGYVGEIRGMHVGDVGDDRVVARKGLDERAAFGFGTEVDGVKEDVELGVGCQFSISDYLNEGKVV